MPALPPIICSLPYWKHSGVHTFSETLVHGLIDRGCKANILFTAPHNAPDTFPYPSVPYDVLPVHDLVNWRSRWNALSRYIRKKGPCLFIQNLDPEYAVVPCTLADHCKTIGILHSDDPSFYSQLHHVGMHWHGIVSVSRYLGTKLAEVLPQYSGSTAVIPHGVRFSTYTPKQSEKGVLRLLYLGRLIQQQKNIFLLPDIVDQLKKRDLNFHLTIVGIGPDTKELLEKFRPHIESGHVKYMGEVEHKNVRSVYTNHTVFLLPSFFEGLPISLLEAMSNGCIPIVSDVESGVSEVIVHGKNGWKVPTGSTQDFVEKICILAKQRLK